MVQGEGVLRGLICFDNDGTHIYCETSLYSDTQWELEKNTESIYAWSHYIKRLSEYSARLVWPATTVPRTHWGPPVRTWDSCSRPD